MIKKKIQSIYTQLILFYSVTVVCMLFLIAVAFYWETQNVMNQADYNFVTEEANNIKSIMSDDVPDQQLLKRIVIDHPVRTRNSLYRYYVRLLDEAGQVVMETPGIADIIKAPPRQALADDTQHDFIWHTYQGDHYLTLVLPVTFNAGDQHGYVQVALDTSYQHSITHDRRIFIAMLVFGMLLSLLIGKFVTSRGLRSLDVLTETVKTITTSSLSQRVDPFSLPKELAPLTVAFNQMLDRIETSFARMHQMSADMSHELRTPITNLIGQTELLLSYDYTEAEFRNAQASNLEELQRMASLVENILFLARAESQQPEIMKEPIDVMITITNLCEYYQALAEEKNINIVLSGSAANLRANSIMFRRMLSNLISNAVKYTLKNGVITITVSEEGNNVVITVADNGIGVAPDNLPKLFDRFYRVDDSRSAQISGTGLGLSIVKSIIDLHHGSIMVLSEMGLGTHITITLPK
jgi:two-component system heavy metal sensor histidine kinase CusS